MNHGVLFSDGVNRKHSADDWGLIFNPFDIPFPSVKTDYVEIEGGNGTIDLTEAYGKIFYKDNVFSIVFTCTDKVKYEGTLNEIASFIHGRKLKIVVYFDELYHYDARVSINKYACDKTLGIITLNVIASPYKLKNTRTVITHNVTGIKTITCNNDRMETVPTFKSETAFTIIFNGKSYEVRNTVVIPEIEFVEGKNILELQGKGTIEISYQEGRF